MALKYFEWPDDEHDRFIRLAQTLDTLTDLLEAFPHRSGKEVMDKAESMGCLAMLVAGDRQVEHEEFLERLYDGHDAFLEEKAGVNRVDFDG